jgi:hypothetical protein
MSDASDFSKAISIDSRVAIARRPVPEGVVVLSVCQCKACKHRSRLRSTEHKGRVSEHERESTLSMGKPVWFLGFGGKL